MNLNETKQFLPAASFAKHNQQIVKTQVIYQHLSACLHHAQRAVGNNCLIKLYDVI